MSDISDENPSTLPISTDYLQPVDTDRDPIIYDGNRAHIAGNLDAVSRFYKRNGLFQMLITSSTARSASRMADLP